MATADEEHGAMVGLFEDKIMEMIRRRVELNVFKSVSNGQITLQLSLVDKGRSGNEHVIFLHGMPPTITLEAEPTSIVVSTRLR